MKLSEQYSAFYQAWVNDGGIENNLKWALLASGAMPATETDLADFTIQSMKQGTAILENIRAQQ